ncbi:MAG TPA: bifunctional precorrin-2 dehydrogenase/sirohydrochlorin ferrochelatase [Bryobacteraceae bacterium]|nr:bifunctional precorrin-2 dehydrogenase/sirohydrochlorin ferrochelatase [Bryobacteraceae bacterium]
MTRPLYYPVFLDLDGKRVLVVGAGKVALRKTRGLVEAGARVTVVAPRWEAAFEQMAVELRRRKFRASDLRGAALVFTATDDRAVNRAVGEAARRQGIPANVADAPAECGFLVPARVRRGAVQIAISTSGRDPRRAAELKRRIAEWLASQATIEVSP